MREQANYIEIVPARNDNLDITMINGRFGTDTDYD